MDPFTIGIIIAVIISLILGAIAMLLWNNSGSSNKINKLEVPTTDIGTPIGVLYGTKIIKAPILAEYGDVEIIMRAPETGGKK